MEFTISRVVLCICGIAMLVAVSAYMGGISENVDDSMAEALVDKIAAMLDSFASSQSDELLLSGWDILPSPEYSLSANGFVLELKGPSGTYTALTGSEFDFDLSYTDIVTIEKGSVAEGLGDVADGIGEDVDLLHAVVEVHGGPRASVYAV